MSGYDELARRYLILIEGEAPCAARPVAARRLRRAARAGRGL